MRQADSKMALMKSLINWISDLIHSKGEELKIIHILG